MTELLVAALWLFALCTLTPTHGGVVAADVQLLGSNSSEGQGQLQLRNLFQNTWSDVCGGELPPVAAQVACQDLGFSYFSHVSSLPEPSDTLFAVISLDCVTALENLNKTLAEITLRACDHSVTFVSCDSTVYLECSNASQEEYGLVAFSDRRQFWVIAPDRSLLLQCSSVEFYCQQTYLVPLTALFFNLFGNPGGATCGTILLKSFLGVDCTPGEGDVCLDYEGGGYCSERGVVNYVKDGQRLGVCAASFAFLEAHVVCSQHGLSKLLSLSSVPLPEGYSQSVVSVNCSGAEGNLNDCSIEISNTTDNCTDIASMACADTDIMDAVLLGVSDDPLAPFTLISPADDVYVADCQASTPLPCPGVHYVERALPIIQDIFTRLQNASCSDLGAINITENFTCSAPPTPTTASPMESDVTPSIEISIPIAITTSSPTVSESNTVLGVSIGVILPLLVLIAVVSVVVVAVIYRRRQARKIKLFIQELQTIHEYNKDSIPRGSTGIVCRPHRSVHLQRRPSVNNILSEQDLEIPFSCITLDKEIGSGAYGAIYHGVIACEHQMEPVEVAIKVLKKMATASERRSLMLEIDMMKGLEFHRHLVTMVACCTMGSHLALIMEFISGGNLHDFLRSCRQKVATHDEEDAESVEAEEEVFKSGTGYEALAKVSMVMGDKTAPSGGSLTLINQLQFARQITLGMEYLASKKIVHRDLAARNILMDGDQTLKLSDFGLSRDIKDNERYHMQGGEDKLPVRWMAAESIVDREFTPMSDVWAFGVVLWEIITYAAFPFYHLTNREVITSVKEGERMAQPEDCPTEVYEIMIKCWKTGPQERPSIRNVRKMLDDLLDTGGYMFLLEPGDGSARRSPQVRGSPRMESFHSFQMRNKPHSFTTHTDHNHLSLPHIEIVVDDDHT